MCESHECGSSTYQNLPTEELRAAATNSLRAIWWRENVLAARYRATSATHRCLEVRAGAFHLGLHLVWIGDHLAAGALGNLAHLFELLPGGELLGEQRGLDAVK